MINIGEGERDDAEASAPAPEQESTGLQEGRDYYFEGQLIVFTSEFLLRRGYCCESGCRHCPYGFKKKMTGSDD
jgi:hypothetical protein